MSEQEKQGGAGEETQPASLVNEGTKGNDDEH